MKRLSQKPKPLPSSIVQWIESYITEPALSFFERHHGKTNSRAYHAAVIATRRQYKHFAEYFLQHGESEDRIINLLTHSMNQRR